MLLENLEIDPAELPEVEKVTFEPLESDYLYLRLTMRSLFLLLLGWAAVVMHFSSGWPLPWMLAGWGLLAILIFFLEIRGFSIKGYALRQKDVTYKSGLIWFGMTSVPFNRIQHCEVSQGPLARLFDLASVKVYTAGGSSSDLAINGLPLERAHRLRDYITRMSEQYE